jgi:4-hydroxy-tetrahydrodipicolinate reductase
MKIALVGYGKMGKEIEQISLQRAHEIVLVIDRDNGDEFSIENIQKADVVIEFSTPLTALGNYKRCMEAGVPVVSGTTGWLDKRKELDMYCSEKNAGFFYASNFSLGVNLFFELNNKLASMMNAFPEYNVDIEETHHLHKLDAPSGTAISIAEGLMENIDRKNSWNLDKQTSSDVIRVDANRIDNVPGTHTVRYFSDVDEIKITHEAYSRKGFALGAVIAAEFMKGKQGQYSMKDLLFS